MDDARWTMEHLAEQVASVLHGYEAAANGQVRAVPDERAIRYYTTLGLIDRPAAMRGRTALYSRRHLAQVVAIKRLQSAGRSLAEIAQIMPTLDDAMLVRVSGVAVPRRSAPAAGRSDFWRGAPPAPAPAPPDTTPAPPDSPAAHPDTRAARPDTHTTTSFATKLVLELAPGVTIAIDPDREAREGDADAIARAAAPLLAELRRRRLIPAGAFAPAIDKKEREEEPR